MNHNQFVTAVKILVRNINKNSERIQWLEDVVSEWKYKVAVTKGKDVNLKVYLQESEESLKKIVEEQKALKKMLNLIYTLKQAGNFEKL